MRGDRISLASTLPAILRSLMSRGHRFRRFRPILHPAPGRKLPRELRVGRVGRLAATLPQGLEDPGFEILLRRIDGAPFLGGNRVEIFFEGRTAFAAMREAALAAQREILLESYIFKDDATGRLFLEGAKAAAARGLKVRVLADAMGSYSTRAGFWREMESHGIETHLFHPVFKQLWYQPFRDHRKILVVDREVAFTGGMNIGEEYGSPNPRPGQLWRDTHVRVAGPAAWEMAVVFSEGWQHAGGEPFEIDPLPASAAEEPGSRILVLDSRPNRRRCWRPSPRRASGGCGSPTPTSRPDGGRCASWRRPPRAASTSACCCRARPTCRWCAMPATATTARCSNAACGSSSTRRPSCTRSAWWRTASSPSWGRRTSTSVPSSSTPSAIW